MKTLSKEMQASISPLIALDLLKKGNERFVNNLRANRDLLQQVNETSDKQHPFAIILSCIDSRTSAELIFDQGLGDIFSARIAGNIVNDDIIGSMEFACKLAGAKIIVVLGHTSCGAIKGACDNVQMGKLSILLDKIKPAINAETSFTINRNSGNKDYVERVAELNVKENVRAITERSAVLQELINSGAVGIIGGMYDIGTGKVDFYSDTMNLNTKWVNE